MFQTACELLFRHRAILPIEITFRKVSGKVNYGVAAGVLVNRDGWILTAGHVLEKLLAADKAIKEATLHRKRAEDIGKAENLSQEEREKQLRNLGTIDPNCPTNISCKAGLQEHRTEAPEMDVVLFREADLGLLKIGNFNVPDGYTEPYFRKEPLRIGEMICRIGFPFYSTDVGWDEQNKIFISPREPIPPFANEGIVSRFVPEPTFSGKLPIRFIETSAPGLKGQSGGPLFDTQGRICGIQSHTYSYPLGFSPVENGQTEHQFLNVGRATQVSEISKLFGDHNIAHSAQ